MEIKRLIIRGLLSIVVLIGLAYLAYVFVNYNGDNSYTLEYGNIDIEVDATAYIMRQEIVVETDSTGQVQYFVAEGEKIKNNQMIAQIQTDAVENENNDASPDQSSQSEVEINREQLEYDISYLLSKIKFAISNNRYAQIGTLKNQLELKLEKQLHLKDVETQEPVISESNNNEIVQLHAPMSGIVSYYIDGYEDFFVERNLFSIDFDKLMNQTIQAVNYSTLFAHSEDIIYKVINGNDWKLIAMVDTYYKDFFNKGKSIEVRVDSEIVRGEVVEIISQNEKLAIVIKMQQLIDDFQKTRVVSAQLYPSNYRGLLIENTSLVKNNGTYGVYVLNVNNKANFVPVKIVGYDENFAIVMSDSFTQDGKLRSTVSLYDEVIRDGEKYNVNQ